RRRGWRGRAQEVLEGPLAADDRRSARGVRREGQDAALAQQPAAPGFRLERNASKPRAVDVRQAVMLGEPFVEPGVVRPDQLKHTAILPQDLFQEQLRLTAHRLTQVV